MARQTGQARAARALLPGLQYLAKEAHAAGLTAVSGMICETIAGIDWWIVEHAGRQTPSGRRPADPGDRPWPPTTIERGE
jgi:hypothetical protein